MIWNGQLLMLFLATTMFATSIISGAGLKSRMHVRCGEDLLELVGQEVVDCVRKEQETADTVMKIISNIFPVSEESKVYREQGVCIMMSRIVNKCTAMWRNCYNDKEVEQIQSLQMSELKQQHKKIDFRKCAEKLAFSEEDNMEENDDEDYQFEDEKPLNATNSDNYYDYSIKFASVNDADNIEVGDKHNCDQRSCQVEIHSANNQDKPGFFGSITKLLQPLFILDL